MAGCLLLCLCLLAVQPWDVYSYPVEKGVYFDSSYGGGYQADPVSSNYLSSRSVSTRPLLQRDPRDQLGAQHEPTPSFGSGLFSGLPASSTGVVFSPVPSRAVTEPTDQLHPGNFQDPPEQLVLPASVFSSAQVVTGPATSGLVSRKPGNVRQPGPAFQPGALSSFESTYEHGAQETELEEQGFQPSPFGSQLPAKRGGVKSAASMAAALGGYPYAYMFLNDRYPPGTITHYNSNFEHGKNSWEDLNYLKPSVSLSRSSEQQVQPFPSDSASTRRHQSGVPGPVNLGYLQGSADAAYPQAQDVSTFPGTHFGNSMHPSRFEQLHKQPSW